MIAGHGTPDQAPARLFAYRHPEAMQQLLDVLAEHSADYLIRQIEAGADAVQIFDSWSGVLDEPCFEAFCVEPVAEIVRACGRRIPRCRSSPFRRVRASTTTATGQKTGATGLGLDWTVPLSQASACRPQARCRATSTRSAWSPAARRSPRAWTPSWMRLGDGPLIFNLGHGITPDTPIDHVEAMVAQVQESCAMSAPTTAGSGRGRLAMKRAAVGHRDLRGADGVAVLARARKSLPLGQGDSCDRRDLLDGRHALSAAAVRLSRRSAVGSPQSETFKVMERRLLRAIINPAMIVTWVFGLWLAWDGFGFHGRLAARQDRAGVAMSGVHGYLAGAVRRFAEDRNDKSSRHWRIVNEVPTLLMIAIVILVIVKPF